eukprot:scaffold3751_cov117-Isochrysis_galbana.AAC.6
MTRGCARARGHGEVMNFKTATGLEPAPLKEAPPMLQDTTLPPTKPEMARFRLVRSLLATAAPAATAATLPAAAARAQPPKTAPDRDLRRGT